MRIGTAFAGANDPSAHRNLPWLTRGGPGKPSELPHHLDPPLQLTLEAQGKQGRQVISQGNRLPQHSLIITGIRLDNGGMTKGKG